MTRKPRLFIASSAESLDVAEAVNVNLDHDFEVTLWTSGTFRLSSTTIEDLVEKSSAIDFALFIFAPDDIAVIKERKERVVRDNVLFEMGLFIGSIGKERCFTLKPRGIEMHLPTDLLGSNPADYAADRTDGDLVSATNRACSLIKTEADRLGPIDHVSLSETRRIQANPRDYSLGTLEYRVLATCMGSQTFSPVGVSFGSIVNRFRRADEGRLQIAVIKLERMGLVEKMIETDDQYDHEYFVYLITELGIDMLLKNETVLSDPPPPDETDFDDDIPF